MKQAILTIAQIAGSAIVPVWAGQAPGAADAANVPLSGRDQVYAAEQFSNTVSVTNPATNTPRSMIRLGDPRPANFSPLCEGQLPRASAATGSRVRQSAVIEQRGIDMGAQFHVGKRDPCLLALLVRDRPLPQRDRIVGEDQRQ